MEVSVVDSERASDRAGEEEGDGPRGGWGEGVRGGIGEEDGPIGGTGEEEGKITGESAGTTNGEEDPSRTRTGDGEEETLSNNGKVSKNWSPYRLRDFARHHPSSSGAYGHLKFLFIFIYFYLTR